MKKFLVIFTTCFVGLWLSNVAATQQIQQLRPLDVPFLPTRQLQTQSHEVVQNQPFIPKITKAEVQLMAESVLKQLKYPQAFDCQIHLKGTTIGQHILKYHVNYNGKKSRLGDAYYSTDQCKSLFVSKTSTGMDVLTMIQQSIIDRSIQDFNVFCCIHDGILDLVIQLRVKDLQYYTRNERKQGGYITICVRKVWLGDRWSCNLTPSTIYPDDKMKTRIRIINQNQPNQQIFKEYQELEAYLQDNYAELNFMNQEYKEEYEEEEDGEEEYNENIQIPTQQVFEYFDTNILQIAATAKPEDVYSGEKQNGKKHGTGTVKYADGNEYTGEWQEDEKYGSGTMKYVDGSEYTGGWRHNKKNGQGKIQYNDGSEYNGKWLNDLKHREGVETYKSSTHNGFDTYTGEFQKGKMNGKGTLVCANGDIYSGRWKNNHLKDGCITYSKQHPRYKQYNGRLARDEKTNMGVMEYSDGSTYQGEWLDDVPHGAGQFTTQAGEIYKTTWNNGVMQFTKETIFIDINKHQYQGEWLDGKPHGTGKYILNENLGVYLKSTWDNGKLQKIQQFTDAQGNKYKGDWDATLTGVGRCNYKNGDAYEGMWLSGQLHGKGKKNIFANGIIYDGEFKQGEFVAENQNLKRRGVYSGGVFTIPIKTAKNTKGEEGVYIGQTVDEKPQGRGILIIDLGGSKKEYHGDKWNKGELCEGTFVLVDKKTNLKISYTGPLNKGLPHGVGVTYIAEKYICQKSQWDHGELQEIREFTDQQGNHYKGRWRNEEITGSGECVFKNQDIYTGEWVAGKRHGFAIFKSGGRYYQSSQWDNDIVMSAVDIEGNKYTGRWNAHLTGSGKCAYKNGDIYEGAWVDGMPNGMGKKTIYKNGIIVEIQEGEFYKGELCAKGTYCNGRFIPTTSQMTGADKDAEGFYVGQKLPNMMPNGQGTLFLKNGNRYEGNWENGVLHAPGVIFYANGDKGFITYNLYTAKEVRSTIYISLWRKANRKN